ALHRKRLADHATRSSRKLRPVRPELKFHRNSRYHSQREADSKNAPPETGRAIVQIVAGSQRERLQDEDQQGKAHRELRKNVVKRNGEGKVQAVHRECVPHGPSTRHERYSAHPLDAIAKTFDAIAKSSRRIRAPSATPPRVAYRVITQVWEPPTSVGGAGP